MLTKAQHQLRATGIGSSEIAAVAGLNHFATPRDVWLRKMRLVEDTAGEAAYWGTKLEHVVAREWAKRHGVRIKVNRKTYGHAPIFATPDYWVVPEGGLPALLECKTTGKHNAQRWGEEGTDQIPREYLVQVQWQMGICGAHSCHVAVLIGGNDFRRYVVDYDHDIFSSLEVTARRFWERYMVANVEPPASTEAEVLADLCKLEPKGSRLTNQKENLAIHELWLAKKQLKEAKVFEASVSLKVKEAFGELEELRSPYGVLTFKKTKGSGTDWKALAQEMKPTDEQIARHQKPGVRKLHHRWEID